MKSVFSAILPTHEGGAPELLKRIGTAETIAVVGSSGNLLYRRKGSEIDSHDVVIRVNAQITAGYEQDVGTKTSVRVAYNKPYETLLRNGELTSNEILLFTCPKRLILGECVHVDAGFRVSGRWVEDLSNELRLTQFSFPSTGAIAIALARAIASELHAKVNIFGFGRCENCAKFYDCDGSNTSETHISILQEMSGADLYHHFTKERSWRLQLHESFDMGLFEPDCTQPQFLMWSTQSACGIRLLPGRSEPRHATVCEHTCIRHPNCSGILFEEGTCKMIYERPMPCGVMEFSSKKSVRVLDRDLVGKVSSFAQKSSASPLIEAASNHTTPEEVAVADVWTKLGVVSLVAGLYMIVILRRSRFKTSRKFSPAQPTDGSIELTDACVISALRKRRRFNASDLEAYGLDLSSAYHATVDDVTLCVHEQKQTSTHLNVSGHARRECASHIVLLACATLMTANPFMLRFLVQNDMYNFNFWTATTIVEGSKLVVCCTWSKRVFPPCTRAQVLDFMIPSLLFATNNFLVFAIMANVEPVFFQIGTALKIVFVSILFRVVLKRSLSRAKTLSIVALTFGVSVAYIPGSQVSFQETLFVVLSCFVSSAASIYNELFLKKHSSMPLAEQNIITYAWGVCLNVTASLVTTTASKMDSLFIGFTRYTAILIGINALTGLLVSYILKEMDNMVKVYVHATSTVITLCIYTMFDSVDPNVVASVIVIVASTIAFANSN
jgi:hypothetical protein